MGNNQTKHRTVELDNVRKNNIVAVDLNQRFAGSVFAQEYKKAARVIRHIIHENMDHTTKNINSCANCRNRNCSTCKNRDRHSYNLKEFHTAVPFIGDRGTGKSSIMCSVLEYLGGYCGDRTGDTLKLEISQQSPRFITFDMIDVNTLNSTEDVMEIILSRMLTYLEELTCPDDDFRELYRMIDELHEDLSLVYWKQEERQEYGLTGLQRIADSQKSITKFRVLVEQFNKDVSRCHFGNNPCYLVIALDDIDMYQGGKKGMADSQFALLDHIYNHMRIPGLIVLMTYNEHMLRRRCNAHFNKIYFGHHKPDDKVTPSQQKDIDELTAQFMSKLFPQERRIYMPNFQYVDSGNQSNLYVNPYLSAEDSSLNPNPLPPFTSEVEELPVKTFMLRLIAHKTGVYFDATGTKQHFFEPRNLRELGELFEVIHSMAEPARATTDEEKEHIYESNRQELLNYLYNQFALKHLATEEYREFSNLSMLPIVRQSHTMVDYIRDRRKKTVMQGHLSYLDAATRDQWRYSYGELLHNIYFSTRIFSGDHASKTIYTKEFIRCILGTHSVLLNQVVDASGSSEDAAASVYNSHIMMLDVIGSSIAGRWANKMVPKFKTKTMVPRPGASLSLPIRYFFHWSIPDNVTDAIVKLSCSNANETKQVIHMFLKAFLLVGMFFTGFPVNGLKIHLRADLDDVQEAALFLSSSSDDHVCFNVMNFVVNLYDAFDIADAKRKHNGYLSKMVPKLKKLGKDLSAELSKPWKQECAMAEMRMQKYIDEQNAKSSYFKPDNDPTVKGDKQVIKRATEWAAKLDNAEFDPASFMKNWDILVDDLVAQFSAELTGWCDTYGTSVAVLPIQHFDMMYNIMKRLADVSYHDIPVEAPIEDILAHYAQLYKSVAEELENQDSFYTDTTRQGFAEAFRSCIFYKEFTAPEETRNPFLNSFLVNMLSNAITTEESRDKVSDLSLKVSDLSLADFA